MCCTGDPSGFEVLRYQICIRRLFGERKIGTDGRGPLEGDSQQFGSPSTCDGPIVAVIRQDSKGYRAQCSRELSDRHGGPHVTTGDSKRVRLESVVRRGHLEEAYNSAGQFCQILLLRTHTRVTISFLLKISSFELVQYSLHTKQIPLPVSNLQVISFLTALFELQACDLT